MFRYSYQEIAEQVKLETREELKLLVRSCSVIFVSSPKRFNNLPVLQGF